MIVLQEHKIYQENNNTDFVKDLPCTMIKFCTLYKSCIKICSIWICELLFFIIYPFYCLSVFYYVFMVKFRDHALHVANIHTIYSIFLHILIFNQKLFRVTTIFSKYFKALIGCNNLGDKSVHNILTKC